MDELTKQNLSQQRYLTGDVVRRGRRKVEVDMEAVYKDFRDNMTLAEVCSKHQISATTLYRRHDEYQKKINEMKSESKEKYSLPPLPKDF